MLNKVQKLIDSTNMYRVVLYGLIILATYSLLLSIFGKTSFTFESGIVSLITLVVTGHLFNNLVGGIYKVHIHKDSQIITSLILYLLFTPTSKPSELLLLIFVSLMGVLSKYILTINKTHVFNPAAIAAFFGMLFFNYSAMWWVGSSYMFPLVLIFALVVLRKQRKFIVSSVFLIVSYIALYSNYGKYYPNFINFIYETTLNWPLLFFVSVMVTEPFTLPKKKVQEYIYFAVISIITCTPFHFSKIGTTPELALLIGNIGSFLAAPRFRYYLQLIEKKMIADGAFEFIFKSDKKVKFEAGQYMEVMLPHEKPDNRGVRRFFTVSSSPTSDNVSFGVKVFDKGSTFKNLLTKRDDLVIYAQQLRGDFVITDLSKKYIFIAGGIGITPFISMIRHFSDTKSVVDAHLCYLCTKEEDIAYRKEIDSAAIKLGIKVHYLIGTALDENFLKNNISDFVLRTVYISGPNGMVDYYTRRLVDFGLKKTQIKRDFFNGY